MLYLHVFVEVCIEELQPYHRNGIYHESIQLINLCYRMKNAILHRDNARLLPEHVSHMVVILIERVVTGTCPIGQSAPAYLIIHPS